MSHFKIELSYDVFVAISTLLVKPRRTSRIGVRKMKQEIFKFFKNIFVILGKDFLLLYYKILYFPIKLDR